MMGTPSPVAYAEDLVTGIREGRFDGRLDEVHQVVAETVVAKLLVANPDHFV